MQSSYKIYRNSLNLHHHINQFKLTTKLKKKMNFEHNNMYEY